LNVRSDSVGDLTEGKAAIGNALQNLRVGFAFSLISVVTLTVFFLLFGFGGFLLWPFVDIAYVLSIVARWKGWKCLGKSKTGYAVLCGGALLASYPFLFWLFLIPVGRFVLGELVPIWSPIVVWGFYTCVENFSLRELGKMRGLDLRLPRILAMLGVVNAAAVTIYTAITFPSEFYYVQEFSSLSNLARGLIMYTFPFLVLCCLILILKMRSTATES